MKKLICVILTLVMALSLVACGSKETASVSTDGSTSIRKRRNNTVVLEPVGTIQYPPAHII